MPSLFLANAEEVLPDTDPGFADFVATKTMRMFPRFLLGLRPGDCLVTPVLPPEDFRRYVADLMQMPPSEVVHVREHTRPYSLVDSLMHDLRIVGDRRGWRLEPFMQTARSAALAARLGLDSDPTPPRLSRTLNDKAAFRDWAREPAVPASTVHRRDELEEALRQAADERCMLRKACAAGGAGNMHGTPQELLARLDGWYGGGPVLVEPFVDFAAVAGTLVRLDADGPRFLGVDLQVIRDGAWSGFDYPFPAHGLEEPAIRLARRAWSEGARGWMNLDWGFPAGEPDRALLLECNLRHNGFGYVLDLARRLFGETRKAILSREGLPTTARGTDDLLGRGLPREAVVTLPPQDGAFSVAVFAADPEEAAATLHRVEQVALA